MDFAAFVGLLSSARSAAFNGLSLRNPRDPGTLSEGMVFPHFGYIKEFAHHLLRDVNGFIGSQEPMSRLTYLEVINQRIVVKQI